MNHTDYFASGLFQKTYCAQHNIAYSTFKKWRYSLKDEFPVSKKLVSKTNTVMLTLNMSWLSYLNISYKLIINLCCRNLLIGPCFLRRTPNLLLNKSAKRLYRRWFNELLCSNMQNFWFIVFTKKSFALLEYLVKVSPWY